MINELNTIVQFLSTIYVTITIDNLMFKRFWTSDLYNFVEKTLNNFDFALSTPKRNDLLTTIKRAANEIEYQSRIRGAYFLLLGVSLMVLFLFETNLDKETINVLYFSVSVSIFISFLIYIYGIFKWSKLKSIFISYGIVLTIFFLNIILIIQLECCDGIRIWLDIHKEKWIVGSKLAIISFLVFPILLRLFVNWLNSIVYVKYLNSKLSDEFNAYCKTKDSIKNKDIKGCDSRYDGVYKDAYYSQKDTEDSVDTSLVNKVVENLIIICKPLSTLTLIKYWWSKDFGESVSLPSSQNISNKYDLPKNSYEQLDYETYVLQYSKMQGVSIADFCKREKIDEAQFRDYRRKTLQKNDNNISRGHK